MFAYYIQHTTALFDYYYRGGGILSKTLLVQANSFQNYISEELSFDDQKHSLISMNNTNGFAE